LSIVEQLAMEDFWSTVIQLEDL